MVQQAALRATCCETLTSGIRIGRPQHIRSPIGSTHSAGSSLISRRRSFSKITATSCACIVPSLWSAWIVSFTTSTFQRTSNMISKTVPTNYATCVCARAAAVRNVIIARVVRSIE